MLRLFLAVVLLLLASPAQASRVLAVLSFDVDSANSDYQPLGRGIANMLITDLERTGRVDVVERERLNALLEELNLQQSAFADPSTAQKLGKGVGATDVLTGGITESGGTLRIDARTVTVSTGEVGITAQAEGKSNDFFKVFERLVRDLVRALKVDISTRNEKQFAIRQGGSLNGAVQYGKAVTAYDDGDHAAADRAMQVAAGETGNAQARKIFSADIKPLPPFFVQGGLSYGVRSAALAGDSGGASGAADVALGWAVSEKLFLLARVTVFSGGQSVGIRPTHHTNDVLSTLHLRPAELGARVRLGRVLDNGVYAAASGGIAPGAQRLAIEGATLARKPVLAVTGSGGADMVFIRYERVGVYAGVHGTVATFDLGDGSGGLQGRGTRVQTGAEVRFGYIAFGGRR